MQTHTVYEAPNPAADRIDRADNLAFVRDGFIWSAALFTPVWLLLHRLWWALLAYVVLVAGLHMAGSALKFDQQWIGLASLGLNLIVGFEAEGLRRWALERRGWTNVGTATGSDLVECERRFFESWLPAQPIIASPSGLRAGPAAGRRGWLGFGGLLSART